MVRSMIWNIALNYSRTLAQKCVTIKTRQDRRSFRSTSAEGRKNTEENSRVSITQRRSSNKSPIREHQPLSLQTSPRYNTACAALQTESQTEDNENTGKE
ncbi:hypothetical protein C0J52_22000 [Blattella germanica]|nr:hypothetical protein C0J52_22000 [Blattella germanica]